MAQTAPVIPAPDGSSIHPTLAQSGTHSRWKWLAAGAVMLCVAVAAVFYWRAHRAPSLTERDTIVLGDFDNRTGDPVFDDTLKQALTIQLEQSPFLNVLSNRKVRQTLKFMNRSPKDPMMEEVTREVCVRSGSKAMVLGSIAALGNEYVVALRAVDCNLGESLVEVQERAVGKEAVLNALDKAITGMRSKLGESLSSIEKYGTPLPEATTSSLEALRAYSMGNRAERGGRRNRRSAILQTCGGTRSGFRVRLQPSCYRIQQSRRSSTSAGECAQSLPTQKQGEREGAVCDRGNVLRACDRGIG